MASAASSASAAGSTASSDKSIGPIYHEVSPTTVLAIRVLFGCSVAMVILAFIFCLVKGSGNSTFYLLACNIVISSFVGIVNTWWYHGGALGTDKTWYVILVAAVIIFQCLTTDIYVFHAEMPPATTTTAFPSTTTTPNHTTTTSKHTSPKSFLF